MPARLFASLLALCTGVCGCSSTPVSTHYYLLSQPDQTTKAGCPIELGILSIPDYLKRSHIVVQTSDNRLTPAATHRWSEPLAHGARRVMESCLADESRVAANTVDIDIEHFHGSTSGQVIMTGTWQVRGGESHKRFRQTLMQDSPGYDALVTTHRALLLAVCRDIQRTCDL